MLAVPSIDWAFIAIRNAAWATKILPFHFVSPLISNPNRIGWHYQPGSSLNRRIACSYHHCELIDGNCSGRPTSHRVAIGNHRRVSFDGEKVTFRWKDYAHETSSAS
jgi:hypothetical protein